MHTSAISVVEQILPAAVAVVRNASKVRHVSVLESPVLKLFNNAPPPQFGTFTRAFSTQGGTFGKPSESIVSRKGLSRPPGSFVSNARSYISDPKLARLVDEVPLNQELRKAYRFQVANYCHGNAIKSLAEATGFKPTLWFGYSNLLQPAAPITEDTSAANLKELCDSSGPVLLQLYGLGRGYAAFHVTVLSSVLEVNGRHVGVMYDGNDADQNNPVLQAATALMAKKRLQPHRITKNDLQRLDLHAQAFVRIADLDVLVPHSWKKWLIVKDLLDRKGIVHSCVAPSPETRLLAKPPAGVPAASAMQAIREYLEAHPELIETEFPGVSLEHIHHELVAEKIEREALR